MSYVTEAEPEMADDPLLEQMAALLETARREGYERGYADAVRRILEAASTTPQEGTVPARPRSKLPAPTTTSR